MTLEGHLAKRKHMPFVATRSLSKHQMETGKQCSCNMQLFALHTYVVSMQKLNTTWTYYNYRKKS